MTNDEVVGLSNVKLAMIQNSETVLMLHCVAKSKKLIHDQLSK